MNLVSEVIKNIKITSEDQHEANTYAEHFPALTILLRDFSLDLEDKDGNPITPD